LWAKPHSLSRAREGDRVCAPHTLPATSAASRAAGRSSCRRSSGGLDTVRPAASEPKESHEIDLPTIVGPYRWRDWAAASGFTGDDLLAFINQDEAVGPTGEEGPGLFAYLRNLAGTGGTRDRRDVIANVF